MAQEYKPLSKPETGISRFMHFAKAEDGATMVLGLFVFVVMLAAGGMAVDFMKAERERADIQYTLDRAILAGAALSQPLDPESVVRDYFDKSGIENYNLSVELPDEANSINSRRVEADASINVRNYFVNMVGIPDITVSASGAAEERVQNVEISLVLDVSGSMGRDGRMDNMKLAAKEFVNTVLKQKNADRVSINIVPYNMQVNAGQDLLDQMNVTDEHAHSHCVDFDSDEFNSTSYDPSNTYQRTGHFDPFYTTMDHPATSSDDNDRRLFMCPTAEWSEVRIMSQSITELETMINAMQPGGNTSIDIGIRWGSMLLDPSINSVLKKLKDEEGNAQIESVFSERPAAYSDDETIKILVVMTDGVNTDQYTLNPEYASGPSNIWASDDSTIMSIYDDYNNKYHITNTYGKNTYGSNRVYGDVNNSGAIWYEGGEYDKWWNNPYNHTGNARQLDWAEVWAMMGTRYNAYYNQYNMRRWASEYYDWRDGVTSRVNGSQKNARMSDVCNAAKNNEIVVFTIGFEVTTSSAQVMQDCASSESHFYRVEGVEISDAFNAIAQTIQRLKLTN